MAERTIYSDNGTVTTTNVQAIPGTNTLLATKSVNNPNELTPNEAYTIPIGLSGTPVTPSGTAAAVQAVSNALSDNSLNGLTSAQKQDSLTIIANSVQSDNFYNAQRQLIDSPSSLNTQNIKYAPKYDYSQDLKNSILNPSDINGLTGQSPQLAKIDSASTLAAQQGGITVNERNKVMDGEIVNPYKNVQNPTGAIAPYDLIGGSDLTVFMVMEYVPADQLMLDPALQKKDIMMIEMDNVMSISYSTIRERFPVRQLGKLNPVALTGGLRTIAGHIAFAIFTEDVLSRLRSKVQDEVTVVNNNFKSFNSTTPQNAADAAARQKVWDKEQAAFNNFLAKSASDVTTMLDQLPPFNLLVMGTNEAGTFSQFMIKGVSIVDENQYQGTQQPNIVNKVSYVATDLVPMQKIKDATKRVSISSASSIDESFAKGKYSGKINPNYEMTGSGLVDALLSDLG